MRIALPSVPAAYQSTWTLPLPVMVVTFCILWSAAFAVAKVAIVDCPPLLLLSARFLAAGAIILGIAFVTRAPWTLSRRDLLFFAIVGIADQALYLGLGYIGLQEISAGLSTLIASSNPILIAILAVFLLGERMTWRKAAGLLLGFGGVAFIVSHRLSLGGDSLRGILFTVAGLLALVGGTLMFKLFAPKDGLWVGNGVQSRAAAVCLHAVGRRRHRAELAAACGCALSCARRFDLRIPALVPYPEGVGSDRGEFLSLSHAAARHAVRLAAARRARLAAGFARDRSGSARHLSRDARLKRGTVMSTARLTLIGGPTALVEFGGFHFLTDPTFDGPGEYRLPHTTLTKTSRPACTPADIGAVDAVLLSHDQHADNLDRSGRDFLSRAPRVFTTLAGAKRLGGHAEGLAPWQTVTLTGPNGRSIDVTAAPARHGPAGIEPLAGDVIGFVLTISDRETRPIYITGDTVWYDGVAEVARRFKAGIVLLFAGAAQTRGPFHLTMDTNDAIETAQAFPDAVIVPVHYEGWTHFRQSGTDLQKSFDALGFGSRLRLLTLGQVTQVELPD